MISNSSCKTIYIFSHTKTAVPLSLLLTPNSVEQNGYTVRESLLSVGVIVLLQKAFGIEQLSTESCHLTVRNRQR